MTIEEAIKVLRRYDVNFCDSDGNPIPAEDLAKTFDMAIKSLEAWGKVRNEITMLPFFNREEVINIIDKYLSEVSK